MSAHVKGSRTPAAARTMRYTRAGGVREASGRRAGSLGDAALWDRGVRAGHPMTSCFRAGSQIILAPNQSLYHLQTDRQTCAQYRFCSVTRRSKAPFVISGLTSKMHSRLPNAQTCRGRAGSSATQMASRPNSVFDPQRRFDLIVVAFRNQ